MSLLGDQNDQCAKAGRFPGPLIPNHQETVVVPKLEGQGGGEASVTCHLEYSILSPILPPSSGSGE